MLANCCFDNPFVTTFVSGLSDFPNSISVISNLHTLRLVKQNIAPGLCLPALTHDHRAVINHPRIGGGKGGQPVQLPGQRLRAGIQSRLRLMRDDADIGE